MIRSVFGHMRFSLPEGIAFWALILCDFSQRPQGRRPGWAKLLVRFSHGKDCLSGGGFSRQASFWLDGVMGHGTGRV